VPYSKEEVIDIDGQVLTKTTYKYGTVDYRNAKGQYHRLNGPAYTEPNGYRGYWVAGKRHRIDGPALTSTYKPPEYWVDGIQYTEKDYPNAVKKYLLINLLC
jgi:hypothetical protein